MRLRLIILSIAFPALLNAQVNTAKLDSLFMQLDKNQKAMVTAGIMSKGKLVYQRTIGWADVDQQIKSNDKTLFHIGSISKMFTSVLIFKLIEEKKITLETTLSKYYPSLPNAEKITIAQLLNHSSGLHNFTSDTVYFSYMETPKTEAELISIFEKNPPDFEPGKEHSYSNAGYVMLSLIIEKVSGKPYNQVLQEKICKPLGLTQTRVGTKINSKDNVAFSYSKANGLWKKETETDMTIPRGAGAITSTAKELCTFIDGLFQHKLISKSTLAQMTKIEKDHGSGIFEFPYNGRKTLGHTGGIDGFISMAGYFPDDSVTFCVLGNGYDYPSNDIVLGMLSIYYQKPYTIPTFVKKVLSKEQLKSKSGVYRSEKVGMSITISEKDGTLMAQAEGQSAFPLNKVTEQEYTFEAAKIKLVFQINDNGNIPALDLWQGGMTITFDKIE